MSGINGNKNGPKHFLSPSFTSKATLKPVENYLTLATPGPKPPFHFSRPCGEPLDHFLKWQRVKQQT